MTPIAEQQKPRRRPAKPKIRMQYRRSSAPTDQAVEFEIPSGPAPDEIQVISVTRREGDGFGQFVFDYEYVLIWR